jgi:hypothetical protein
MEPIVLRPARGRLIALLVGAIGFVIAGLLIIVVEPSTKNVLVGVASIVFFGGGAVVFSRQLVDSRARFVLSDEGIMDSALNVGVIPWDNVVDATVQSLAGNSVIILRLRSMDAMLPRLSAIHRRLARRNKALGFAGLSVNVATIDTDPRELAELISKEAAHRNGGGNDGSPWR